MRLPCASICIAIWFGNRIAINVISPGRGKPFALRPTTPAGVFQSLSGGTPLAIGAVCGCEACDGCLAALPAFFEAGFEAPIGRGLELQHDRLWLA